MAFLNSFKEFMNAKHFRRNFSAIAENRPANSASLRLLGAPESQSFARTILAEKTIKKNLVAKN